MSASLATKVGGGIIFAAGTPASIYFSWDHITLYSVEREVLSKETLLDVKDGESGKTNIVVVKKESEAESPWTCKISIKDNTTLNKDTLKGKLPTAEGDKDNSEKQNNKSILVRRCAGNRDLESTSEKIVATLEFPEVDNDTKLISTLFG